MIDPALVFVQGSKSAIGAGENLFDMASSIGTIHRATPTIVETVGRLSPFQESGAIANAANGSLQFMQGVGMLESETRLGEAILDLVHVVVSLRCFYQLRPRPISLLITRRNAHD
jgi:hypothetical protein